MQSLEFKASLDIVIKRITIVVAVAVVVIIPVSVLMAVNTDWTIVAPLLIAPVVLIIVYGLHPVSYIVSETTLSVKCPFYTYTYPKAELKPAVQVDKEEMKYSVRAFGVGGFFGNFGIFYNKQHKWMTWFTSRRDNYVMIEQNKGRKLVFTPDDPQGFIAALK